MIKHGIPLDWTDNYEHGVRWIEARVGNVEITIEPRPAHCDRGRFYAKVFDPQNKWNIDEQDCFPRYYFDLQVAKSEMEAFAARRAQGQ